MKPGSPSADAFILSLPPGTRLDIQPNSISVAGARRSLRLEGPLLALRPLLDCLVDGARQSHLIERLEEPGHLPLLLYFLAQLEAAGLLARSVAAADGGVLATLVPVAGRRVLPARELPSGQSWTLSRFAFLRRDGSSLVLESPVSEARLILVSQVAAAILHRLAEPASQQDLAAASGAGKQVVEQLVALLAGAGFLEGAGMEGAGMEPEPARLWEFHDLLFHWHSRLGRREAPYGGVFAFADVAPLPSLKPPGAGETVALPGWEEGTAPSASLASVMARRRSLRLHGEAPITIGQLGALLYRSARQIRAIETAEVELASRPYPAGGALYELELYVAVDRCDGLERGLLYYRPGDHCLERLSGPTAAFESLLDQAALTLGGTVRPQLLLVVAARFQRLSLKYRSVTYSLILKHVGVLYQTLYLVATDLGLAPCAMGGGDSMLFAQASGLDPMVESSVGEFALGSRGGDADAP